MPPVPVSAQDATLSDAVRDELAMMLKEGTSGGVSLTGPYSLLAEIPSVILDLYEIAALAQFRVFKRVAAGNEAAGGPAFPQRVPQFSRTALPVASDFEGSVIYVADSTGTPTKILAYSDGTSWLRSDTGVAV